MNTSERRDNARVAARFDVSCLHEGDYLISFSKDISVDGMFVCTDEPLDVGSSIELFFKIDDLKLAMDAQVVWVNANGTQKDKGMGVKFIGLDTAGRENILRAVNRVAILEQEMIDN